MSNLRDFFTGAINAIPEGQKAYQQVKENKQKELAQQNVTDTLALNKQTKLIKGAEANRALAGMDHTNITKDGTSVFDDNTDYPLDFVQSIISAVKPPSNIAGNRPYFQFAGQDAEGKPRIFDTRTGKFSTADEGIVHPREKTLPADTSSQLADFDTLSDQLALVKQFYKPDYVGIIQGRLGEVEQATGIGASKEQAIFRSNINSVRNQLLYLRSGKQINEAEYKRLVAELPDEKKSSVDFEAKLVNFEHVFDRLKTNRRNALSVGYHVPPANPQQPSLQQNNDPLGLGL